MSATLSLLYIWQLRTLPWHKTRLAAWLPCNESAALQVLRAIDYGQNSCYYMHAISLIHLKNLRVSLKPI